MDNQEKTRLAGRVTENELPNSRGKTATSDSTKRVKKGKLDSMLEVFATGRRLHRFQAVEYADWCLHSTVASLQDRHGIHFQRRFVKVPNRFGGETRVMEYWLEGEHLQTARKVIGLDVGQAA